MSSMELICDLEVHSKYARAVSKNMIVPEMAKWADWKGITLLGTGDFTHPEWMKELQENLTEDGTGLLRYKDSPLNTDLRFILTAEVSSIFSQGGKGRRIHTILVAPSFAVARAISERLATHGKLTADGRPILGVSVKKILGYVLEVNEQFGLTDDVTVADYQKRPGAYIIPAHVWTPWFGLYGSKSGFDSLEEAFEELTPHVRAIETGLSSDPLMNWRLSKNDAVSLVSFSDAHSAPNLMREATVINVKERTYGHVAQALQNPKNMSHPQQENSIAYTLEFFPEEGKYHYDGIADQELRLSPAERKALAATDPVKAKKVTIGVLSRVDDLADRPENYQTVDRPPYISVIPLQEIIADVFGVGKQSKRVQKEYERIITERSEFDVLLHLSEEELEMLAGKTIARGIMNVRQGNVVIEPGYDGVYGTIALPK